MTSSPIGLVTHRLCLTATIVVILHGFSMRRINGDDGGIPPIVAGEKMIDSDAVDDLLLNGSSVSIRRHLDDRLLRCCQTIEELTSLTPAQRLKLNLAGKGDIEAYLLHVDTLKRDVCDRPLTLEEYTSGRSRSYALKRKVEGGLHGYASLLQKTLRTVLEARQLSEIGNKQRPQIEADRMRHIDDLLRHIAARVLLSNKEREAIKGVLDKGLVSVDEVLLPLTKTHYMTSFHSSLSMIPEANFLSVVAEERHGWLCRELRAIRSTVHLRDPYYFAPP